VSAFRGRAVRGSLTLLWFVVMGVAVVGKRGEEEGGETGVENNFYLL
jgi:hypothetical protein